jgi:hypothetical protein
LIYFQVHVPVRLAFKPALTLSKVKPFVIWGRSYKTFYSSN